MRYLLVFMLLVGIFVLGKRSCVFGGFGGIRGEGPLKTETRNESGFHAVNLDISGDVEVSAGDYRVEVQAQENLLPHLKTEVNNGLMRIYFDENVSYSKDVKIRLSAPSFDGFNLMGSGTIKSLTPLQSDKLDLKIGGSGDIVLPQSTVNSLECSIIGSGSIEIGGKANSARMTIAGSGDLNAKSLEANELRADITGSGSVTVHVLQVLKANIAGSGDVFYTGDPVVEKSITGSGSVTKQ